MLSGKGFRAQSDIGSGVRGQDHIKRPLWDPRTGRMEATNNRALQLLDRLMDKRGVDIEAFKRVADICDGEEGP